MQLNLSVFRHSVVQDEIVKDENLKHFIDGYDRCYSNDYKKGKFKDSYKIHIDLLSNIFKNFVNKNKKCFKKYKLHFVPKYANYCNILQRYLKTANVFWQFFFFYKLKPLELIPREEAILPISENCLRLGKLDIEFSCCFC